MDEADKVTEKAAAFFRYFGIYLVDYGVGLVFNRTVELREVYVGGWMYLQVCFSFYLFFGEVAEEKKEE